MRGFVGYMGWRGYTSPPNVKWMGMEEVKRYIDVPNQQLSG